VKAHAANRAAADQFASNVLPFVPEIQAAGVTSLAAIAAALNARGRPRADVWAVWRGESSVGPPFRSGRAGLECGG